MKNNWQNSRDILLFIAGLGGVFHETVLSNAERPTLLILFAAMMGLPAFLRSDEKNLLPRARERESKELKKDNEKS